MKLIPHCLTAIFSSVGIRSLIEFSNPVRPIAHSVLYLRRKTDDAAPKCISRRTSYLRVRLAFHPYPQLIRAFFNIHRFGPPRSFTLASTWTWVDHTVSGLIHAAQPPLKEMATHSSYSLSLRLHKLAYLDLQRRLTRRLILQKARYHTSTARSAKVL